MTSWQQQLDTIIAPAVARSTSIDAIDIDSGNLERAPVLIREHLGAPKAGVMLIADGNTHRAAGERLEAAFTAQGITSERFVYDAVPRLKPSLANAKTMLPALKSHEGIIVAVGSGVINDLVKYAAHNSGKPYACVATAASMDGYASAGSPLSDHGFKHTIPCAPPRVLVADMDVVAKAPEEMAGWGYGDLAGKVAAGADWIVADALGIEAIDDVAWPLVHEHLRACLAQAASIREGQPKAMGALFAGLVVTGLAMELHGSSRPASGADHQIGHLWEMRNVLFQGAPVAHGACVALGTLSVLALYDWLLRQELTNIDVDALVAVRPSLADSIADVERSFGNGHIAERSVAEVKAKYANDALLRSRLDHLRADWPALRARLRGFLVSAPEMRSMLSLAGVITDPLQVNIDRAAHRRTILEARLIRRRYTVLDLLYELGMLESAVETTFTANGYWGENQST